MKKVILLLKGNWFQPLICIWLCWVTFTILNIKDNVDRTRHKVSSVDSDIYRMQSDIRNIESDVSSIKKEVSPRYSDYGKTLRSRVKSIDKKLR